MVIKIIIYKKTAGCGRYVVLSYIMYTARYGGGCSRQRAGGAWARGRRPFRGAAHAHAAADNRADAPIDRNNSR